MAQIEVDLIAIKYDNAREPGEKLSADWSNDWDEKIWVICTE